MKGRDVVVTFNANVKVTSDDEFVRRGSSKRWEILKSTIKMENLCIIFWSCK